MYREEEYYQDWKKSKSNKDLVKVINEMEGLIHAAALKWGGGIVGDQRLMIKAKLLAADAIKNFNPNSGTKLSTYVNTYLQKLSRTVYDSGVITIPEQQKMDYGKYLKVKSQLEEEQGSSPTLEDMKERLNWGSKKILTLERNFTSSYNDSVLNTNKYLDVVHKTDEDLVYAYENLDPEEQKLFTLRTGWPTGKGIGIEAIANKRGMSVGFVSQELKRIASKMKVLLGM